MRLNLVREPQQEPADYRDWKPWFAWHPIFFDGKVVWLEFVERSHSGFYPPTFVCPYYYRLVVPTEKAGERKQPSSNANKLRSIAFKK